MSPRIEAAGSGGFLIPGPTALAELVVFLAIFFVFWKYIVPYVNGALAKRQEAIRQQFQDAEEARQRLEATEAEYREQLAAARADAARQREEAREQGAQILADLRAQAQAEAERITKAAQQQIEAERSRTITALRTEVGQLAVELAGRIVGEALQDDARQHRVIEAFIADIDSRAGEAAGAAETAEVHS